MRFLLSTLLIFSLYSGFSESKSIHSKEAEFRDVIVESDKTTYTNPELSLKILSNLKPILDELPTAMKIEFYSKEATNYLMFDKNEMMIESTNLGLALVTNDFESKSVVDLLNYKGTYQNIIGNKGADIYHEQALQMATRIDYKVGILDSLLNLSAYHINLHQFMIGLDYCNRAYEIADATNNKQYIAHSASYMSDIYTLMQEYEDAVEYGMTAIDAYNELGHDISVKSQKYMVSGGLIEIGKYNQALAILDDLLKNKELTSYDYFIIYLTKSFAYEQYGDFDKTEKFVEMAERHFNENFPNKLKVRLELFKLSAYLGNNKLNQARDVLDRLDKKGFVDDSFTNKKNVIRLDKMRSEFYEKQGDYSQSLESYKKYSQNWVSFKELNSANLATELRIKFQSEQLKMNNTKLKHENELSSLRLQQSEQEKKTQLLLIALAVGVVMIISPMLMHQYSLRRKLTIMVNYDSLTRVANRYNLMRKGDELFTKNRRRTINSVMMLDIDNFKSVNDTYGHNVGDEVLKKMAELGKNSVRENDLFGRMGGEEFVVILPNTTLNDAKEVGERIKKNLNSFNWSSIGIEHTVTASIGVSCMSNQDTGGFEKVLSSSDSAMYQAKNSGKNKVCAI